MHERIKKLRKKLGLTQKEFGERLGVKPNTIGTYEIGRNEPIDAVISLICREFNVNETWLRDGKGDMFSNQSREDEITRAVQQLLSGETSDFKRRLTLVLSGLKEEHWVLLEQKLREMVGEQASQEDMEPVNEEKLPEPPRKIVKMPKAKKNGGMVEIKVYDQPAAAGLGNYLDDPDYHMEYYPEGVIHPYADFGVLIDGDSMEPKVHDGGTVFVESMQSIEPGQIGIFVLNGKSYCKKLAVDHEKRQVRLVSLNKKYEDIIVGEFDSFRTLGRVRGQFTRGQPNDIFGW